MKEKKKGLSSDTKGNFYWNGKDITMFWLEFFAMLPAEKEKDCVRLFEKKLGKKLDSLFKLKITN